MVKRKNSPVKKGIKSYFEVIPKPPPKRPRGRPRKQPAPALVVVDDTINNNEVDTNNEEKQSFSVRKGSSYTDYNKPDLAAALKEAIDYFLASGKIMTANDAELSNRPFIHIPPSTIRDQAKVLMKELENSKAPPHLLIASILVQMK